jgi:hypothetical protein
MRGLERFLTARIDGRLLSRTVLLHVGQDGARWWRWPELMTYAEGRIDKPTEDMRAVYGLDVILLAEKYTDTAAAIYTRLQDYAASIVFIALSADDGLVWDKTNGSREL